MCRSVPQMPARRTLIRTSLIPISGSGTSSSHSPGSRLLLTSAFILVGQVGNLRPIDNRPVKIFLIKRQADYQSAGRLPTCPTSLLRHVLPQIPMRHLEPHRIVFAEIRTRPIRRSVQRILVLDTHGSMVTGALQHREECRPIDRSQAWQAIEPPLRAIHRADSAAAQYVPANLRVLEMHVEDLVREIASSLNRIHHLPNQMRWIVLQPDVRRVAEALE